MIKIEDFEENVPPMPEDFKICGCGSCKNALDVVARQVENHLINDCGAWSTAIAFMHISVILAMVNRAKGKIEEGAVRDVFDLTAVEIAVWSKQHAKLIDKTINEVMDRVKIAKKIGG